MELRRGGNSRSDKYVAVLTAESVAGEGDEGERKWRNKATGDAWMNVS